MCTYDADGNRVEKSGGGTGTLYWYMTPGIIGESDLSGVMKSEYVFFNGDRVARRDYPAGSVAYYFSDHLKTASIVTDSAGNIKSESDYYPWGGELQFVNSDSNHYKFTGKERDTESGLDYFGARYYSNGLGRFITPDWAAKAVDVPYAEFSDPQSLNLYSYVRNIPTVKVDADGHCPPCDVEDETGVVIPEEEAIGTTSGTVGTDTAAGTGTAAATDASAGVGEAVIQDTAGATIGTIIETVGTVLLPTQLAIRMRHARLILTRASQSLQRHSQNRQHPRFRGWQNTKGAGGLRRKRTISTLESALARHLHLTTGLIGSMSSQRMIKRKIGRRNPISVRIVTRKTEALEARKVKKYTWKEAFEDAYAAARAGSKLSQNFVGYCYDIGRGVQRDLKLARYWYEKAARNGQVDAIFNLAVMNDLGQGMHRNPRQAVRLYSRGAMLGDLKAQANLAIMLLEGDGVRKDVRAGLRWLKKAAKRGDSKAQYNLGRAYLEGEDGVRKNYINAKKWLTRAARGGDARARRLLKSRRLKTL